MPYYCGFQKNPDIPGIGSVTGVLLDLCNTESSTLVWYI